MATKTDIANQAISALGIGKTITDFDTDTSAEAKAVRAFYDQARDSLFSWAPWPFAKEQAALGLITTNPSDSWSYSYTYPSDAIRFLRIVPSTVDADIAYDEEIPFRIQYGSSSREIWTDEQTAKGEYIRSVDDPTRYPPDFQLALAYYVASMIAPRISGGDNFNLATRALNQFIVFRDMAAKNAFNEEKRGPPPESEYARARTGARVTRRPA